MKNKIVEKSAEMFRQFGYSKVTLTEIATDMGISKKTIYNYFDGKEQLLYAVIDSSLENFKESVHKIESKTDDLHEIGREILSVIGMRVTEMQVFKNDLKKTNPKAYSYSVNIHKDVILTGAMDFMQRAKKQGLLRDSANSEMALFIFLATAEKVVDQGYLKDLPVELTEMLPSHPVEIFKNIYEIIYQGIKSNEHDS
jgi:AcrR family transcriptional regulator